MVLLPFSSPACFLKINSLNDNVPKKAFSFFVQPVYMDFMPFPVN